MTSAYETAGPKVGDATNTGFQFLSLDELSAGLRNPVTSAEYHPSMSLSPTLAHLLATEGIPDGTALAWDDHEMNFAMDMDMDLEINLNMMGKS